VGFHELRSSVKLEERLQSFSDSVINERWREFRKSSDC
jgi:hypothetical protein